MINERFFLCKPFKFKDKCSIYPPSVNEILDNEVFPVYKKILTLSQEEIEDEYTEKNLDMSELLTPLEYLLNNAYHNKNIEMISKAAFQFFIHEPVTFLYEHKKIIIGNVEEVLKNAKSVNDLKMLDEESFFEFQNLIRESMGDKAIEPPNPDEDPRVKRIKAKARYRDKIKAKKGIGLSFGTTLVSICCMNFGLNPLNIGELSYAAIPILVRYYQEKDKYELDVDSLLAGADSKKVKPKYWIRNIED